MYFKCKYLPHERDEQSSMGHVSPLHRKLNFICIWIALRAGCQLLACFLALPACNESAPHPNSLIIK